MQISRGQDDIWEYTQLAQTTENIKDQDYLARATHPGVAQMNKTGRIRPAAVE